LSLYGKFAKQWGKFLDQLKLLGKRIEAVHNEYETLTTTRKRQLEKPLNDIENLRTQLQLPASPDGEEGTLPLTEAMDENSEKVSGNKKTDNN
jgi:DNA recombination protein RmuC